MCLETETPYSLRMEVTVSVVSAYSIIPFIKTGCCCRCFYCCFVVIDGADCCLFSFIKSNNCCLKSLLQRDDCCLSFVYCIGNIKSFDVTFPVCANFRTWFHIIIVVIVVIIIVVIVVVIIVVFVIVIIVVIVVVIIVVIVVLNAPVCLFVCRLNG